MSGRGVGEIWSEVLTAPHGHDAPPPHFQGPTRGSWGAGKSAVGERARAPTRTCPLLQTPPRAGPGQLCTLKESGPWGGGGPRIIIIKWILIHGVSELVMCAEVTFTMRKQFNSIMES